MANGSDIREHMEVLGSDGTHVGTVDHVDGDRIKLTRRDSTDDRHHYVPLSAVARVDAHVHLAITAAAALAATTAATGAGLGTATPGSAVGDGAHDPFPPVKNRAVEGSTPRGNFYLPWIVGLVGLVLLLLLFRGCMHRQEVATVGPVQPSPAANAPAAAPLPVEAVSLPNGKTVSVEPNSLNYALQRYLASDQPAPRTFTFDKLNFDTGSAAIRATDQDNVDALAQILAAYPKARGQVVGYTDARGDAPANDQLGQQRADAVVAALVGKGVDKGRIEATSGGEANPADTNATAQGRFDNRRTELVITAK